MQLFAKVDFCSVNLPRVCRLVLIKCCSQAVQVREVKFFYLGNISLFSFLNCSKCKLLPGRSLMAGLCTTGPTVLITWLLQLLFSLFTLPLSHSMHLEAKRCPCLAGVLLILL